MEDPGGWAYRWYRRVWRKWWSKCTWNPQTFYNAPYNAAKAGLYIFTKYLAVVLGDNGIRVNSIAPGPTHSDLDRDLPESVIEMIEKNLPAHRFGEPIEIGALCVFLASPAGRQIMNCVYAHDGGLLCIV